MRTSPHSKIINRVSREVLKPIGVKRQGQSRTWLDDNGWWVTVIEFQPSAWSKGTYLNIGINFQWYPQDHYSFDIGYREAGFVEYVSDEQFESKALGLAESAKNKVLEIRDLLVTRQAVKDYVISSFQEKRPTLWGEFHQGMACAIAGEREKALALFSQVINNPHDTEWAKNLKEFTSKLITVVGSSEDLLLYIGAVVNKSRELKKLDLIDVRFADSA